jgi:hypothetical protein
VILAAATYGFAAANTGISDHSFAEGSGAVSGYEVTSIDYNLDDSNPANLDSLSFNLGGGSYVVPNTVYVQVVDGGSLHSCSSITDNGSDADVVCSATDLGTDVVVQNIDILRIVTEAGSITVTP